jgi:RNA polymerase sigma-70 factor (ECF subfamily)
MPSEPFFAAMVSQHRESVWRWAFHVLQDPDEADDITQDAFLALFAKWSFFRGEASVRTWLYRITMNAALRRRERMIRIPPQSSLPGNLPDPPATENPELELAAKDSRSRLLRCISNLPDHEARAIRLFYFEDRSYDEIAADLNMPIGTVKTHLHRGRKNLCALYEKEESL